MTSVPGRPYADTALAKYIDKQIDALKGVKTQRDIAHEMGYSAPNIISMFKRGEMKVPLDKVPPLAKALHVDLKHLFRLWIEQNWPDQTDIIRMVFGGQVTDNEMKILELFREVNGGEVPELTPALEDVIRSSVSKKAA